MTPAQIAAKEKKDAESAAKAAKAAKEQSAMHLTKMNSVLVAMQALQLKPSALMNPFSGFGMICEPVGGARRSTVQLALIMFCNAHAL